jgi:site-specific recombinase XerD
MPHSIAEHLLNGGAGLRDLAALAGLAPPSHPCLP